MNEFKQSILLSGRKYKFIDIGEGPTCLLVIHKESTASLTISMLLEQIQTQYRVIAIDISDHFPADINDLSQQQLDILLEDLHLLCDIYWLDKVIIRSDYQPDIVRSKFKEDLFPRYQAHNKEILEDRNTHVECRSAC